MERILVPLDGSAVSEAVLPEVRRLLRRMRGEVLLLRAENPVVVEPWVPLWDAALQEACRYLEGIRGQLEKEGIKVRTLTRLEGPVYALLDVARRERASLIAMSTSAPVGLSRILFGSLAEATFASSPVPVWVMSPHWTYEVAPTIPPEDRPIRKILVHVGDDALSRWVFPCAAKFAGLFGASVLILRVLPPGAEAKEREKAREELLEAALPFQALGIEAETMMDVGHAEERIVEACASHEADLLAMPSHGRSGLAKVFTASLPERVFRAVQIPMLVLPVDPQAVCVPEEAGLRHAEAATAPAAQAGALKEGGA